MYFISSRAKNQVISIQSDIRFSNYLLNYSRINYNKLLSRMKPLEDAHQVFSPQRVYFLRPKRQAGGLLGGSLSAYQLDRGQVFV